MIHDAKLLNKNKKIRKKITKKIENTQRWRSGRLVRVGGIALKRTKIRKH